MTFFKKDETSNEVTGMGTTSLGGNISALRKAKGMTQEEFAEKLGVTPQAVSKWENGVSCPDIMLLPRIAEIFGVSIDELMGKEPPKAEPKSEPQPIPEEAVNSKLKLRISVLDARNGKTTPVRISVPLAFALKVIGAGLSISAITGNPALKDLPIGEILDIVKSGATGEILDLTTDDGTKINVEIS